MHICAGHPFILSVCNVCDVCGVCTCLLAAEYFSGFYKADKIRCGNKTKV